MAILSSAWTKRLVIVSSVLAVLWVLDRYTAKLSFQSLDGRLFYSYSYATHMIASLSPQEQRTYMRLEIQDLGFIVTYVFALTYLLPREFLWKKTLAYAPIFTGVFDLLETTTILLVLIRTLPLSALWIPTVATPLKWAGVTACFIALLTRRWPAGASLRK